MLAGLPPWSHCNSNYSTEAACRGSSAGGRAPRRRPQQLLLLTEPGPHREVQGETNPGKGGVTLTRPDLRELQKLRGSSTNHVRTNFFLQKYLLSVSQCYFEVQCFFLLSHVGTFCSFRPRLPHKSKQNVKLKVQCPTGKCGHFEHHVVWTLLNCRVSFFNSPHTCHSSTLLFQLLKLVYLQNTVGWQFYPNMFRLNVMYVNFIRKSILKSKDPTRVPAYLTSVCSEVVLVGVSGS